VQLSTSYTNAAELHNNIYISSQTDRRTDEGVTPINRTKFIP